MIYSKWRLDKYCNCDVVELNADKIIYKNVPLPTALNVYKALNKYVDITLVPSHTGKEFLNLI